MKTPKQRYINIIEKYINVVKKDYVELVYGEGVVIKIHNIDPSPTSNSILIEAVIVLGNVINEEVLDRSMVDYLVNDIVTIIFPEASIKCMVRWDV